MKNINQLLNLIKQRHDIKSDYKLALFLDIREQSIGNYRHERSLPDAASCKKIAGALDIDADLLTVEMEAQRAKTDDARELWTRIAQRLQMGFSNVSLLVAIAIVCIALTSPAARAAADQVFSPSGSLYIMLSAVARILIRLFYILAKSVKMCKSSVYVPRNTHPAAPAPTR